MRMFNRLKVHILGVIFQFQVMVMSHFYLQNPLGIVLKSRCPMLELFQGKNSQILMDIELNILYNYIQNRIQHLTIWVMRKCIIVTLLNVMVHRSL